MAGRGDQALTALRGQLLSRGLTRTQAAWADAGPFTLWGLGVLLGSLMAFLPLLPGLVPGPFVDEAGQPDRWCMLVLGPPISLEWSRRRQTLTAARKQDMAGVSQP
ncbi:hypothetical protein Deipr_1556 [Deinococcus proteolyticus MRP]|uniref:Uncharacterized protein n=1 Tax=Deinococcus proteolyticus (strain ATCC 35074 / DSM 20540 / JCM 6276 / NBRC 101906 / NCIMB 13154 / VKM Ac-1939 / CCM 2703 / MRP) TaxID=693977 RepID=F0RKB5_DEIPM|nr:MULTISPECIES: hypothetical protein [Deinococcus]ADY26694.1 hypothetical protein Deipr_1556 [Deinococcus proteolyticus MRP]MCY1702822.1 hypothetical protein [Deinococcus sp. SL84]